MCCDHENKEYYPATPERSDEPGSAEGWYCPDCDTWLPVDDEATRLGI